MDTDVLRAAIARHEEGFSANGAAKAVGRSASTGQRWMGKMKELNLSLEQVAGMSDSDLKKAFWKPMGPNPANRYPMDVDSYCEDVKNGMTIKECFESYTKKAEEALASGKTTLKPIGRTQFHDNLRARLKELKKKKREMRGESKPDDVIELDVVGDPVKITTPEGKTIKAKVLVAALRSSKLLLGRVMPDGTTNSWCNAIVDILKELGGVPNHFVIDNDTALVKDATRGAQRYTRQFEDLCGHYGIDIAPCRVGEPRDKGLVECGVRIVEMEYVATIAAGSFHSVPDAQAVLDVKLDFVNRRPMAIYGVSRREDFEKRERRALKALSRGDFTPNGVWYTRTIKNNGCVEYDGHLYLSDPKYPLRKIRVRCGPDNLLHFASPRNNEDLWVYRHYDKGVADEIDGFNHSKDEFRQKWELTEEAQLEAAVERATRWGESTGNYARRYVEKHLRKHKRTTADQINYLMGKLEKAPQWAGELACEEAMAAGYLNNEIALAYLDAIMADPNFRRRKEIEQTLEGACLRDAEEFDTDKSCDAGNKSGGEDNNGKEGRAS